MTIRRWLQTRTFASAVSCELRVRNNLTGAKELFSPANSGKVTWYACGPTVYDDAHLGHARTYVSFDIIRRILVDIFGYQVHYTMGITDIDDKILMRARERQILPQELALQYETSFLSDMHSLNVKPATVMTRVSDHIPEVVAFVRRIMENGHAYRADDGSVYFDTKTFQHYGKLAPLAAIDGGTGEVELADPHKRHAADFVLWKAQKAQEAVGWSSPFGVGRPGWHIECSAMTHAVYGDHLDLHTGGIDLRFPHHTNEIAQCEAFGCSDWVKYFLHTGHLHIAGRKMSKSLKNFLTVRSLLDRYSANQFRLFCLLHKYNSNVEYSDDRMKDAANVEAKFLDFFRVVSSRLSAPVARPRYKWGDAERALYESVCTKHEESLAALFDDFDTPKCITALLSLMSEVNCYLDSHTDIVHGPVVTAMDILSSTWTQLGLNHVTGATQSADENSTQFACLANIVTRFRADVRQAAKESKDFKLLSLCDQLRDIHLPMSGVRVEDLKQGHSTWSQCKPGPIRTQSK
eukprot:GILJ01013559.1.p1 GENE.GILJ01013559.1~~GILJ01013559.1.p1  ORF type:complete len:520 (+),score=50.70 GILJ01013559.1:148-1707(+)